MSNKDVSKVIVIGDAYIDFIFPGIDRYPNLDEEIIVPKFEIRAGGSAGYSAMVLSSLDVRVNISSNVGDDFLSKFWLDSLSKSGVNVNLVNVVRGGQIGVGGVFLQKIGRSFITFRGANVIYREKYTNDNVSNTFLMITGFSQAPYLWNTDFIEFIKKLEKETIIILDTNWSIGNWLEIFERIIPYVNYLLINNTEIGKLTNENDLYLAGQKLINKGCDTCIIKKGALGCSIIKKGHIYNVPANIVEPLDLNGAGDFFNAGFVYGLLNGFEEIKSCEFANECAKCAILNFDLAKKLQEITILREKWKK